MYVITKQKQSVLPLGAILDTGDSDVSTFITGGLVLGAVLVIFFAGFTGGYMWKGRGSSSASYSEPGMSGARRRRSKKARR